MWERLKIISRSSSKTRRAVITAAALGTGAVCLFIGIKLLGSGSSESPKVIPMGTTLTVRLTEPISSQTAQLGDVFEARVVSGRGANGEQVVSPGVGVEGRCVAVRAGEGDERAGYLRLTLSGLWDDDGHFFPLETTTYSISGNWVMNPADQKAGEDRPAVNSFSVAQGLSSAARNSNEAFVSTSDEMTFVLSRPAVIRSRR